MRIPRYVFTINVGLVEIGHKYFKTKEPLDFDFSLRISAAIKLVKLFDLI